VRDVRDGGNFCHKRYDVEGMWNTIDVPLYWHAQDAITGIWRFGRASVNRKCAHAFMCLSQTSQHRPFRNYLRNGIFPRAVAAQACMHALYKYLCCYRLNRPVCGDIASGTQKRSKSSLDESRSRSSKCKTAVCPCIWVFPDILYSDLSTPARDLVACFFYTLFFSPVVY